MSYDDTQMATVLNDARPIVIVGQAGSTERSCNQVASYLKNKGCHRSSPVCLKTPVGMSYEPVADIQ